MSIIHGSYLPTGNSLDRCFLAGTLAPNGGLDQGRLGAEQIEQGAWPNASVAQWVEHPAFNRRVVGSSPTGCTGREWFRRGVKPHEGDVADRGSNPLRSTTA